MTDFTACTFQSLQRYARDLFKRDTGLTCKISDVHPLECSEHKYYFQIGDIYYNVEETPEHITVTKNFILGGSYNYQYN